MDSSLLKKAADIICSGGVIVYPTDTAYGLGADAGNVDAVQKVFDLKGRDLTKPIHVVVENLAMARKLVEFNPLAEKIFKKYLPGPLTIVLPKKPGVSDLLTAGLPTLGIRIPDNTVCRELSRLTHLPFTTTSANLSGQKTPYQISDVIPGADLVIDAGQLPEVLPSTVIDLTKGKINILRRGPISFSEDDLVVEGE